MEEETPKPRVLTNLHVHELSLVIHPSDHKPDWEQTGVCSKCGLGRTNVEET